MMEEIRTINVGNQSINKDPVHGWWPIGRQVIIRTVTMIDIGILEDVTDTDFVLTNASWIADAGRWSELLNSNGEANDVEPFKPDQLTFVNRGGYIDMCEIDGDFSKVK